MEVTCSDPHSETCQEKPIYFLYFFRCHRLWDQDEKKTNKNNKFFGIIFDFIHVFFSHGCLYLSSGTSHDTIQMRVCAQVHAFIWFYHLVRIAVFDMYPSSIYHSSDALMVLPAHRHLWENISVSHLHAGPLTRKCLTIFVFTAINLKRIKRNKYL